jgi:hypothetical protein
MSGQTTRAAVRQMPSNEPNSMVIVGGGCGEEVGLYAGELGLVPRQSRLVVLYLASASQRRRGETGESVGKGLGGGRGRRRR